MDAWQLLWEKWQEQVKGLLPKRHGHQQKQLALMVAGIVVSGCALRQPVAETIQQQGGSQAKMSRVERRLSRFLAHDQLVVSELWNTFLSQVLPYWNGQKLTFVLDGTPYNAPFSIISVGLLVHSRVLPGTSWHACSLGCVPSSRRPRGRCWLSVDWRVRR